MDVKTSKVPPVKIKTESDFIQIFNDQTGLPSKEIIGRLSSNYRSGFNHEPWDIYGWNISSKKAEKDLRVMIEIILNAKGALLLFQCEELPLGFNMISDMGVFVKRLGVIERYTKLPREFRNPAQYLSILSNLIDVPLAEFDNIAYLADIIVNSENRGRGYGRSLLKSSLEYAKKSKKKYAFAWSVNTISLKMLQQEGFKLVEGIGNQGEGIDFLIYGKTWYPTLVVPSKRRLKLNNVPIVAAHYFKDL